MEAKERARRAEQEEERRLEERKTRQARLEEVKRTALDREKVRCCLTPSMLFDVVNGTTH